MHLRTLSFCLLLPACGNLLDLGGSGPNDSPSGTTSPNASLPPAGEAPKTPKTPADCSGVTPDAKVIFRSPGSETFNISGLASDGTHVYVSGYGAAIGSVNGDKTPNANDPMRTATLLRVPVAGGTREILDYEHVGFTRGVVVDAANVYWASDVGDAVFMRPKSGGAIASLVLQPFSGPQTMTTDGNGNVFWATFYGGQASATNPAPAIVKKEAGTSALTAFQQSHGEADGASWITTDGVSVYWMAGRGPYELRAAPVAGGPYDVLASGLPHAYSLTTDDDSVWGVTNDSVWKVAKTGGARVDVVKANAGRYLTSLAVTEDAIYFGDDQSPLPNGGPVVKAPLYKANKDGSSAVGITADLEGVSSLTTDGCRVYFHAFDWVGNPGYENVVYAVGR